MFSASNDLAARFSTFQEEAFRLETLDDYSNSGNPAAFRAFLAGETKPADYNADWLETVRKATESGKRMVRVHVLSRPLTPYLRYELSWGYQTNMTAGEEFHILDTTVRPNPLEGVPDFWLFDGREPVVLNFKAEYLAVARAQATEATAWRLFRRMGYHKKQEQIRACSMTLLRLFQPSLIPGLLQTPEYIRAVLEPKGLTDEQLSRTVSARIERQRVLYDTSKALHFVVTEPVLRWRLLPPAMMAGQLDRIVSVSRLPNVDVRVVPLDAPQRDVPGHSFVIRDDRVVTVETTHAEVVVTDQRDVSLYVEKFDRFASVSLAGDAMRDLVEGIRDAFLRERETP